MAATSIHSVTATQVRTLAYIMSENKTENGVLIDSFMCSKKADEAAEDFEKIQSSIGTGRGKILAQHMIISFKPNEIDAERAMEFGKKLCDRFLQEQYQYVLAVHTDKKHIHCHIVFNNTNMENGKSFTTLNDKGQKKSWKTLRELSDKLCEENGLSVIKDPEKSKGKSYYEWDMNRQGMSWKSKLKFAVDECVAVSDNFEDFLKKVREKNIEVAYNPEHKIDLKFRMNGQQKWSRARTLGWYYETPQLRKRIAQYKLFRTGKYDRRQHTNIIDTSTEKMRSSKGLERWANIQNMKEASKIINMLTDMGISDTDQIEEYSISGFRDRMELVEKLNQTQREIDRLSDIISGVRKYKKYKPVYDEYKRQKGETSKKKYAQKNASGLDNFKKASTFLKSVYEDGKVPSEESLLSQRKELIQRRTESDESFKAVCRRLKDLDYARQTIEDYLSNEQERSLRKKDIIE